MKKLITLFMLLCMVCTGVWAEEAEIRPTFVSSSDTDSHEPASNLVDANNGNPTGTKWGCSFTNGGDAAWIIVKANNTILKSYKLYNANDTESQPARRWKNWVIEGSNDPNGTWTEIDRRENQNMVTTNYAANEYTLTNTPAQYSYYKITISEIMGNADMFQMSDFLMTVEVEKAKFVNTSTSDAPQYYTIQNVRTRNGGSNQAYVTADTYGNGCLKQNNTTSVGSYWYFEDASADAQNVDFTIYQPVYIRSAKFGGYLTTDGTIDAAYTKTKPASEKQIYYLWQWDNGSNTDGYLCVSKTAAKTSNGNGTRNSWADRNGNGQEINYYYSQDGGTHFDIQPVDKTTVENLVKEYVLPTANAISADYVGDYAPESVPSMASAKDAYDSQQTSQTLNGLREAYTQEFVWAASAPVRRAISEEKYYVIESAKNGKEDYVIYAELAADGKLRWATNELVGTGDNALRKYFRVKATGESYSGNTTYYIYACAREGKGYLTNCDWQNSPKFCNTTDTGNGRTYIGKYYFANRSGNIYNIRANYPTSSSASDNCTLSAVANNNNDFSGQGDILSWNNLGDNYNNVWRIREVAAPTAPTQNVAISSVGVATFYTGKALEIPEGVTAKKVVDAQDPQQGDVYHLVYEELDEIPAGTPVVLFGEQSTYQFPRSLKPHDYVVTSVAGSAGNRLIGTLNDNDEATGYGENGTLYALGNKNGLVAFYHYLSSTVTAGKAYLDARGINNTAGGGSVRAFAIFDEGTGTITCIDAVTGATIDKGTAFDLAGRRVNANIKGISIVNGKKVIR